MLKLKRSEDVEPVDKIEIPEEEKKNDGFKENAKKIITKIGKRNLTIVLAVLMIGGAVFMNFKLFNPGNNEGAEAGLKTGDAEKGNDAKEGQDNQKGQDGQDGQKGNEGKTGQSQSSADGDAANQYEGGSYFAEAALSRRRARDEAIDVLQLVISNDEALEEAKSVAMAEITQIAAEIENESNIESLITAKGFEECVAVINGSSCSVIVRTDDLLPNELVQIREIVYEQAGILPENLTIIEKKS